MDFHRALLVVFLGLVSFVHSAQLTVQSPRFTISSSQGEQIRSEPISFTQQPLTLTIGPSDTLKVSFQVIENEKGTGVQPHQTFLRFYDEVTGEEGIQPLRVSTSGKAKFELNMARPPSSLPPTNENSKLKVSLIIGSFVHTPARHNLFDMIIPSSYPVAPHPEEHTFHPLPPIAHTFRSEQKIPPVFVSGVASIFVISPWVVLLGFWGGIGPKVPHLLSVNILSFIATIAAFEGLLFWYWIDLRLGQVLLYGGLLSIAAVLTGKSALVSVRDRRSSN